MLLIASLVFGQQADSIYLVKKLGYSSGLCSGEYEFYSDSTFYYEFGCEARSRLSIGTYLESNDTLFCTSFQLNSLNLIDSLVFAEDSDTTTEIELSYFSREGQEFGSNSVFVDPKVKIIDVMSLENDSDLVQFDSDVWKLMKIKNEEILVLPKELNLLFQKEFSVILPKNKSKVLVYLSVPSSTLIKMINYSMIYNEQKSYVDTIDGVTIIMNSEK